MSKMGRPRFEPDWSVLDKVCSYPLKQEDIAYIIGCSLDTLCRIVKRKYKCTFAEYQHKKQAKTRLMLHQKQWEVALKKDNVTMLIWLGKQYLGQRDQVEQTIEAKVEAKQEVVYATEFGGSQESTT